MTFLGIFGIGMTTASIAAGVTAKVTTGALIAVGSVSAATTVAIAAPAAVVGLIVRYPFCARHWLT